MANDLIKEATSRQLNLTADYLRENPVGEPAAPDPPLAEPLATEPLAALEQMVRRGPHPGLVKVVLEWFEGRPLERGLFAWDVLCNAILRDDEGELLEALREAAEPIREVVPAVGEPYIYMARVAPGELVERLALPPFADASDDVLEAGLTASALGAIEVMRRDMGAERLKGSPLPETLAQYARFLNLAHLTTLSSFYLAYLWKGLEYGPAMQDYAEVLLDVGAKVGLPTQLDLMEDGSPEAAELEGYMIGRKMIQEGQAQQAVDLISARPDRPDYSKQDPAEVAKTLARSHLMFADAGLAVGEVTVPLEVVNEIVRANPTWRYGSRVLVLMVAKVAGSGSDVPVRVLDSILSGHGNDAGLWSRLASDVPEGMSWWPALRARTTREVTRLPHDRQAWIGLNATTRADRAELLLNEVENRVTGQCPTR